MKVWLKSHTRLLIALAGLVAVGAALLVTAMLFTGMGPRRLARVTLDTARAVLDSRRVRSYSQGDDTNLVFLHQSTGANLIREGQLRQRLAEAGLQIWDQGYNYLQLTDPQGNPAGYSYSVPGDQTDPVALSRIFSQREYPLPLNTLSGLLQHEVIILKSCFDPTSRIESDGEAGGVPGSLPDHPPAHQPAPGKAFHHPHPAAAQPGGDG